MIQKVEISVDFGFGLSISKCGGLKCLPLVMWTIFVRSLGLISWCLKCLPPICGCWVIWLGFEVSPLICRYWVAWLGFEVSPPIYGYWVVWLGFEVSPSSAIVFGASGFLWLELSCRSKMELWCHSSGVSSMLMGFSTVMGVMGLELELLA